MTPLEFDSLKTLHQNCYLIFQSGITKALGNPRCTFSNFAVSPFSLFASLFNSIFLTAFGLGRKKKNRSEMKANTEFFRGLLTLTVTLLFRGTSCL
jgi:hypothetical protein